MPNTDYTGCPLVKNDNPRESSAEMAANKSIQGFRYPYGVLAEHEPYALMPVCSVVCPA